MEQRTINLAKTLIEEHLNGQFTILQLSKQLKKENILLKNVVRGRGKIMTVITYENYSKKLFF